MKLKKNIAIALLLILSFAILSISANAASYTSRKEAYDFATEFLSKLNQKAYKFTDFDVSEYVENENLILFLNGWISSRQAISISRGIDYMDYYTTEFSLEDYEELDECIYMEIIVRAEFRYRGYTGVSKSNVPNQLIIKISESNFVIEDWLIPGIGDSFTIDVRGDVAKINVQNYWSTVSKTELTAKIADRVSQANEIFIKEKAKSEILEASEYNTNENIETASEMSSITKSAIEIQAFKKNKALVLEYFNKN